MTSEKGGYLNEAPLVVEVAENMNTWLKDQGITPTLYEGIIVGSTIREMTALLLSRGLLNELGVQQVREDEEYANRAANDQQH